MFEYGFGILKKCDGRGSRKSVCIDLRECVFLEKFLQFFPSTIYTQSPLYDLLKNINQILTVDSLQFSI